MSKPKQAEITDDLVYEIAKDASVSPLTVIRRLAGLPVRGLAGQRADKELRRLGLVSPESVA
jgi:hypothetical protein